MRRGDNTAWSSSSINYFMGINTRGRTTRRPSRFPGTWPRRLSPCCKAASPCTTEQQFSPEWELLVRIHQAGAQFVALNSHRNYLGEKKKKKNSNNCLPPLSTNQDVANPGRCSFLQRNLRDGHEQQLLPRIIEHTLCYCGARRSHARGRSRGPGSSGLIEAQTWPSPLLTLLCHIHVWNTCVF